MRRGAVAAVVAAGGLLAAACGGSSGDDPVVAPTTTQAEEGEAPGTTEASGGDEVAMVEDATTALVQYLDAYFRGDHELEVAHSGQWARTYAYLRTIAQTTGDPEAGELDVEVAITGIDEVADGWELEGSVAVALPGITHTYRDIFLVEGEEGDLVVADYCRTNPEGAGPLDGCLSDAVGNVNQKMTSPDGTVTVTFGPFARSMGLGRQSTVFSVVIDNDGAVPVRVLGGPLTTTYRTDLGSVGVPSTSADGIPVAPPGQRTSGVLDTNLPDGVEDDGPFPAGTLEVTVEVDGGDTLSFGPYEVPALPQLVE